MLTFRQELVHLAAPDGAPLAGLLCTPEEARPRVGVVIVNGTEMECYEDIGGWLAPDLAAAGYLTLSLNRRDHGHQMAFQPFEAAAADIGVGVAELVARGVSRVVVAGHSYGAVTASYYAATARDPSVAAIGLYGPVDDMRRASVNIMGQPAYERAVARCRELVAAGRGDEVLAIAPMIPGSTPLVQTHAVFLNKRGPETNAVSSRWLARVPELPVLYIRNAGDDFPGTRSPAPEELVRAHPLSQAVTPAVAGNSLAEAHFFVGQHELVVQITLEWLAERGLKA